jgi:hypothetical protein
MAGSLFLIIDVMISVFEIFEKGLRDCRIIHSYPERRITDALVETTVEQEQSDNHLLGTSDHQTSRITQG